MTMYHPDLAAALRVPAVSALTAVLLLHGAAMPEAHASWYSVFDSKSYQESLKQKQQRLEQWEIQNEKDIEKLSALQDSLELQVENSTWNNKETWSGLEEVRENTANLVSASRALWEEYGSASQYYASYKKASYWQQCLELDNCLEDDSLSAQDEASISFALKAYKSADLALEQLDAKLEALNELSAEAHDAQSFADSLDVLAKINTGTASALLELNTQVSTMVQVFSHSLAQDKNREVAVASYTEHLQQYEESNEPRTINYSYTSRLGQ